VAAIRAAAPAATVEILDAGLPAQAGRGRHCAGVAGRTCSTTTSKRSRASTSRSARRPVYASLRLLERAKELDPVQFTKSGLMVGLGESREEVMQVMDDMRCAASIFITIGQYLQPSRKHAPIDRFVDAGGVQGAGDHSPTPRAS